MTAELVELVLGPSSTQEVQMLYHGLKERRVRLSLRSQPQRHKLVNEVRDTSEQWTQVNGAAFPNYHLSITYLAHDEEFPSAADYTFCCELQAMGVDAGKIGTNEQIS